MRAGALSAAYSADKVGDRRAGVDICSPEAEELAEAGIGKPQSLVGVEDAETDRQIVENDFEKSLLFVECLRDRRNLASHRVVFAQQRFRASLDFAIVAFMAAIGGNHEIHETLRIDRSVVRDGLRALLPEERLGFHAGASCRDVATIKAEGVFV